MKRTISTLVLLTIMLLLSVSALAQSDATAVPTEDVPAATQEATALETEQAIATQEVVVIVTQTPAEDATPAPEETPIVIIIEQPPVEPAPPAPATGMNPDLVFMGLVLVLLVYGMADRFSNYNLSKKLAEAIPADWQPVIEQGANTARRIVYERAGAFADSTEGTFDNNLLDEDMKRAGWEFYIDPTTGNRHARKIVPPAVSPQG